MEITEDNTFLISACQSNAQISTMQQSCICLNERNGGKYPKGYSSIFLFFAFHQTSWCMWTKKKCWFYFSHATVTQQTAYKYHTRLNQTVFPEQDKNVVKYFSCSQSTSSIIFTCDIRACFLIDEKDACVANNLLSMT